MKERILKIIKDIEKEKNVNIHREYIFIDEKPSSFSIKKGCEKSSNKVIFYSPFYS